MTRAVFFDVDFTLTTEAVMVGDSLAHDIEGARRLGMRAVLVRGPGRRVRALRTSR